VSDAQGKIVMTKLPAGVYLFVQSGQENSKVIVNEFLVSLPWLVDGELIYDVDAAPKIVLEVIKPEKPEKPENPTLPQTGQLKWPIPVMAFSGLLLFSVGWYLYFVKKENTDEK